MSPASHRHQQPDRYLRRKISALRISAASGGSSSIIGETDRTGGSLLRERGLLIRFPHFSFV